MKTDARKKETNEVASAMTRRLHNDTFFRITVADVISLAHAIDRILDNRSLDLVLSDMAPNISGVRTVDQARAMDLADIALHGASKWLRRGGSMAIKAFQGEGLEAWLKARKTEFERVQMTKPKASRPESREVFIVALGFKGVEAPEIE